MKSQTEQIRDWQDRVKQSFGPESKLYEYLFTTLENFFYRYIENSDYNGLKVTELSPGVYGAESFESSMIDALKLKDPTAHKGILELAKRVPKAQKPMIKLSLSVNPKELTADRGLIIITTTIDWGFPEYTSTDSRVIKHIKFQYDDLAVFRKQLALKIEEACELFN